MPLVQRAFQFRTWGGKRRGAGRKPSGEKAGVTHRRRAELDPRHPVHVTVRVRKEVWNLRARRCVSRIVAAMRAAGQKPTFRIVHASIEGNHIHFIVEAASKKDLARGMQALCIRIAKQLNVVMGRTKGRVFADRYHAHVLQTPTEVARALAYVLGNHHVHRARQGRPIPRTWQDPCATAIDAPFTAPGTWLLQKGWRRARLV